MFGYTIVINNKFEISLLVMSANKTYNELNILEY